MSKRYSSSKIKQVALMVLGFSVAGMNIGCLPGMTGGSGSGAAASTAGAVRNGLGLLDKTKPKRKPTFVPVRRPVPDPPVVEKEKPKTVAAPKLDYNGVENGTCFDNDCANQGIGPGNSGDEDLPADDRVPLNRYDNPFVG